MKKVLIPLIATSGILAQEAYAADSITEALEASKPVLDLRLRYESNDTKDGNNTPKGDAVTLKSVIGIKTGEFKGFSAYADMTNVSAVDSDYKSSGASTVNTDIVPDPEGDELNQAYLQFKSEGHQVRFGRQRIIDDNARFVGNVGWRQNEQTYDAFTYKNTSIKDVTINLAYLSHLYPIFFNKANAESVLVNVGFANVGPGKLSAYVYALDNGNKREDTTYGVSYAGKVDLDKTKLLFRTEFATQEIDTGATTKPEADYLNLELGAKVGAVTAKLGYELLGSDDGNYGFQTPLATKHKFNGWADKFLSTPNNGLEDTYFSVSGKAAGIKLVGVYHKFSHDEGGADLGTEIDLLAVKKLSKHYTVGAKFASFSGEAAAGQVDTDKFWLWGQAKF